MSERCEDGRLMRHRPFPDDPYFEHDVGKCPRCDGKGCPEYEEEDCPGHVASKADPKICHHCGIHIDSLRPPEDEE